MNIKKIIGIFLIATLCFSSVFVVSAEDFTSDVNIVTTYDDKGTVIEAAVITSEACGAIKATFKYDGSITFREADTTFIEADVTKANLYEYNATDKTVTFVVASDNAGVGDKVWAKFYFDLQETVSEDITLSIDKVEVCDPKGDTLLPNIAVESKSVKIKTEVQRTLGAQYRKPVKVDAEAGTAEVKAALRFGTRIERTKEGSVITIGDKTYTAVSCGYIAGFDFNILLKTGATEVPALELTLDTATGAVTKKIPGTIVRQADRCFAVEDTYLIHTYAITGFVKENGESATQVVENKTYYVADENISARPYVVYRNDDGTYEVAYGDVISKNYREIELAAGI